MIIPQYNENEAYCIHQTHYQDNDGKLKPAPFPTSALDN